MCVQTSVVNTVSVNEIVECWTSGDERFESFAGACDAVTVA